MLLMLTSVELAHLEIAKKRLLRMHAEGSVKTMEVTNMVANVFCYDDEADEAEKMAAGAKEALGEMAFVNNTALPRPMLAMIAAGHPDQPCEFVGARATELHSGECLDRKVAGLGIVEAQLGNCFYQYLSHGSIKGEKCL